MGFFSKKPKKNKVYKLEEAVKFMHEPGNENYSVVETNGGYRLISDM